MGLLPFAIMSAALLSNLYVDENTARIRSKSVPWEVSLHPAMAPAYPYSPSFQGYQRADLITQEELALIKKVDRPQKTKSEPLLLSEGRTYILLYLSLLKKLQRIDTMQSLLILITDALLGTSLASGFAHSA